MGNKTVKLNMEAKLRNLNWNLNKVIEINGGEINSLYPKSLNVKP